MPALFVFLLKVNVALLLFCAGYYLVLRHLTFYTLNRIYLVGAIIFATLYPKINLSDFLQRHQQIAKPVQVVAFNWQAPAKALVEPIAKNDYWVWAEAALWAGIAVLGIRLLIQLYSLFRLYRNSTAGKIYDHNVRIIGGNSGPFSFWKSIFINPANHEPADLQSILLHEQVHVSELHTLDVLLAELSTVFYWFNPGVWLIKKAVRENIEFITDRKILNNGTDSKQYQYSLVNVSFAAAPQGIVNHFNISTIKKRIIMMNTKRSSKYNLTRYAFLVPAVVVLLLIFTVSKAALVKKTSPDIKTFSTVSTKSPEKGLVRTAVTVINKASAPVIEMIKGTFVSPKINTKVTDTIRKGGFFLSTSENTDSLNYVINGVKATKADLLKIDEKKIYSVNIMSGDKASKLMDNLDKKQNTLFVTTDDSEAGKKFKEKIDKATGGYYAIAGGGTYTLATGASSGSGYSYSGDDDGDVVIVGTQGKPAKVRGYSLTTRNGNAPATVVLQGRLNNTLRKTYSARLKGDTSLKGQSTLVFSLDSARRHNLSANLSGRLAYTVSPNSNYTWSSNSGNRFSLDHISDKMIIINGTVASEADLKKISAFDIDKVVFKNDDETKELYGEKAKKGIVFIVTRKAGKK